MRLIDADALNGYKFGLISPYAQNLFHKIINEAPTIVQEQKTGETVTEFADRCRECGREKVLNKIRDELHATAEIHEDGDFYLREEWIDEIFDKYKPERRKIND